MLADSFFQQGITHEVCEDYAIHGDDYGILSDGCSNGGGPRIDTDFGARLLVKAAEENLHILMSFENSRKDFLKEVWNVAQSQQREIYNLSPESLTATLGIVYFDPAVNWIRTLLIGDGVFGGVKKDGTLITTTVEATQGGKRSVPAPFYLKYMMTEGETETYFDMFGGNYRIANHINYPDGNSKLEEFEFRINPESPFFVCDYPVEEFDYAFIGSDGIESFHEKINTGTSKFTEPVSATEVLKVLFDGINFRPNFLKLQKNWAFKKNKPNTFIGKKWENSDDVSLAVISSK